MRVAEPAPPSVGLASRVLQDAVDPSHVADLAKDAVGQGIDQVPMRLPRVDTGPRPSRWSTALAPCRWLGADIAVEVAHRR